MTDKIFILKMADLFIFLFGTLITFVLKDLLAFVVFLLIWLGIYFSLPGYRSEVAKNE
jgi:hypothetical protein